MSDIARRLEKAEKYLQKGKLDSALEEYFQALESDPSNDAVRQSAADLCVTLNRTADAARLTGELFDHEAAAGDGAKAAVTYKRLSRYGKPTVDQTFRFGQFIEKTNKKEALEAFETSFQGLEAAGRKRDALAALGHLVGLDPNFDRLRREGELAEEIGEAAAAAQAFLRAGQTQQAGADGLAFFERAHRLDAANAQAALACGQCYLQLGRGEEAVRILEAPATAAGAAEDVREAYARALLATGHAVEAEPFVRELYDKNPERVDDAALLVGVLLDAEEDTKAMALARMIEEREGKRGRRREYITLVKETADKRVPRVAFLEYLVEVFNSANREQDYCETLGKLFALYYAVGNFLKAGDALDRAAEVDPYEEGHQKHLEMLRGKIDANRFNAIANRFGSVVQAGAPAEQEEKAADSESTVLEDLMLQAEIFLQYSMRSKAVERLERISKLFPHEEEKNEKLHLLYANAGFFPKYTDVTAPKPVASAPAPAGAGEAAPPRAASAPVPQAVADEAAVDNFSRVTEITRNIYRQGTVKGVLFTAVNDIGRHWNASRCTAALMTPGKPPSAALEYCAPGVPPADVVAVVKLVMAVQALAVAKGVVKIESAKTAPELDGIREQLNAMAVESLVAVPLFDGEEHAGILILEQCAPRPWRSTDVVVLKTIADQMLLAANNSKLRSLVKSLAITDEKSGLLRRSSYLDVVLSEVRHSQQQNAPMSVMLLQFGNAALLRELKDQGLDQLMEQVGQVVCGHIRQNDVAVRYDRNTIALVLSDTSDKNAFFVVDKLRNLMTATHAPGTDSHIAITAGIAEAVLRQEYEPVDIVTELINRVEAALDSARAAGGNNAKSLAATLADAVVA